MSTKDTKVITGSADANPPTRGEKGGSAASNISALLLKMIAGTLSADEHTRLDEWCRKSEDNLKLCRRLQDPAYIEREYRRRKAVNTERPFRDMLLRIKQERLQRRRKVVVRVAVAACFALLLGGLGALYYKVMNPGKTPDAVAQVQADTAKVIRPGETKAVLTLPDGRQVALGKEDAANNKALQESAASAGGTENDRPKHLSLAVPRGGEFKIELEDGTEVWLNSASRLVYPEHFAQAERRVSVQGEAYFKVKHDAERPFYVETDGQLLRVYGTEFNVRSYKEDANVLTTLVQGSVALGKLNGGGGELVLTPGHQSSFSKSKEQLNVRSVDTDVVTSWRQGRFVFEDQSLADIMRDLSRWYDFNYTFADDELKNIVFMGSIPRYADFNTALSIIEKSGGISFSVSGKQVRIKRKKQGDNRAEMTVKMTLGNL